MRKPEKFDEMFRQIQRYIDDMPRLLVDMPTQLQQIAQKIAVLKLCWPLMESHPGVQVDIESLIEMADLADHHIKTVHRHLQHALDCLDALPQGLSYRNPFHTSEGG